MKFIKGWKLKGYQKIIRKMTVEFAVQGKKGAVHKVKFIVAYSVEAEKISITEIIRQPHDRTNGAALSSD